MGLRALLFRACKPDLTPQGKEHCIRAGGGSDDHDDQHPNGASQIVKLDFGSFDRNTTAYLAPRLETLTMPQRKTRNPSPNCAISYLSASAVGDPAVRL